MGVKRTQNCYSTLLDSQSPRRKLKENFCNPEHVRNEESWKASQVLSPASQFKSVCRPSLYNNSLHPQLLQSPGPHRGCLSVPPLALRQRFEGNVVCLGLCSSGCESKRVLPTFHFFNLQREEWKRSSLPKFQQLQWIWNLRWDITTSNTIFQTKLCYKVIWDKRSVVNPS